MFDRDEMAGFGLQASGYTIALRSFPLLPPTCSRPMFRLSFALTICLASLLPAYGDSGAANVLFIAVDDLRVELGCYGMEHVESPHIDRLAARGTLFERAYCQQTVCNPSRASVLTGMRPDTLGVWDLPTHFREKRPEVVTLPQLFMGSGYHAQCVGKIFHNWRQDRWRGDAVSWSTPSMLHYDNHGNDTPRVTGEVPPNTASGAYRTECRDVPDDAYFDGRVATEAVAALREIKNEGRPFFLAVGFWKPHAPFNAPKKYWDMYDPAEIPLPERVVPPDDVPSIALTADRYTQGREAPALREMHHGYLAAISYVDAQIGRVLGELTRLGLEDETIVVFWSDHGLHLGEHGLLRKTTTFELDARTPLIIATPQHAGGQQTEALVELLDLYPTLADLCGLAPPEVIEGESLVPLLEDPAATIRSTALTQTPRPNYPRGEAPEKMGYSIRTDRYRYTEWRDHESGAVLARELYDHAHDPGEAKNIARHPGEQATVHRLGRLLGGRIGRRQ